MKAGRLLLLAALVGSASRVEGFVVPRPGRAVHPSPKPSFFQASSSNVETTIQPAPSETSLQKDTQVFTNDGLFAWMQPYLKIMGFVEGKTLVGAVPMSTNNNKRDAAQSAALRRQAADALQNIGDEERARRDTLGNVLVGLSLVYATWASLLADDGGLTGHVLRALLALPLFLAVGFKLSAQQGL